MKIMLDLETLGTKPNSVILSIGAVAFSENGIHEEFYVNIDLESSIKFGFSIDSSTVYWWLKQSSEAGEVLDKNKLSVRGAINKIIEFIDDVEPSEIWANSPSFDCIMLKNYYEKTSNDVNWDFWQERDFRTFMSITNADRVKPTVAHNALEDAKAQAQTLINYWKK